MQLTITVRRALDPYSADPQYIAYSRITLTQHGLDMTNIGVGKPGEIFAIYRGPNKGCFTTNSIWTTIPVHGVIQNLCFEGGSEPILTVVEKHDITPSFLRQEERLRAKHREEQIAYLKGLFIRAENWVASAASRATHILSLKAKNSVSNNHRSETSMYVIAKASNVATMSVLRHRQCARKDGYLEL